MILSPSRSSQAAARAKQIALGQAVKAQKKQEVYNQVGRGKGGRGSVGPGDEGRNRAAAKEPG